MSNSISATCASNGRSLSTGPGRPERMMWKACWNTRGAGGAGSAEADADIAGLGAGVALSHMRGAFDVAREHVLDRAALLHRRVQRVDGRSRNAERLNDAFLLQNGNSGVYCSHTGHSGISLNISFNWHTECQKASVLVNLFQNIFAVLSFYIFFYYIS